MKRFQVLRKGSGWFSIVDHDHESVTVETIRGVDAADTRCAQLNIAAEIAGPTIQTIRNQLLTAHRLVHSYRDPHFGHLDEVSAIHSALDTEVQRHQDVLQALLDRLEKVIVENVSDPDWRRRTTETAALLAAQERRTRGLKTFQPR